MKYTLTNILWEHYDLINKVTFHWHHKKEWSIKYGSDHIEQPILVLKLVFADLKQSHLNLFDHEIISQVTYKLINMAHFAICAMLRAYGAIKSAITCQLIFKFTWKPSLTDFQEARYSPSTAYSNVDLYELILFSVLGLWLSMFGNDPSASNSNKIHIFALESLIWSI